RDADLTSCPGDGGYSVLPAIRSKALAYMGKAGLVQPSVSVAQRTLSANGSVRVTAGMISSGSWSLLVQNSAGTTVRTLSGSGSAVDVTWGMTDNQGRPVPAGVYTLTLSSTQSGNTARPWSTSVAVGAPFGSLDAVSSPAAGKVRVHGWAVSGASDNPVTVRITVGGATVGTTSATAYRPDIPAAFPGYSVDHGYDATFAAPPGAQTVCAYGVSEVGGPDVHLGWCRTVTIPAPDLSGNPRGNFEVVDARPGAAHVTGWALDPNTADPIRVHAYVDGTWAGAFTASAPRPDVAAVFPTAGPNHGFDALVTGLLGGTHTVCMYAINVGLGTTNPLLGCRSVILPGGNPGGNLEAVQGLPGAVRVVGWALDPDTPDPIVVHVYVDGGWGGLGRADGSRADVAAAFPGYGAAHGFDFTVPIGIGGTHQVCAYAINVGVGSRNPEIGCRWVSLPSGPPFGSLDIASGISGGIHVAGWAIDPDVTSPIRVHLYVDGRWTAALTADADRPDVAAAFPGYGAAHGFAADLNTTPGRHTVCAYAINVGLGGVNPLLRCLAATAGS
ncbi:MAG: hypothetical protein K6T28_09305, partial [Acidothermus sp.]|nr:hypothetical protein [Acidothermus sp.]